MGGGLWSFGLGDCTLETIGHLLEGWVLLHIRFSHSRLERVQVKERVFAVVNSYSLRPVSGLKPLVAHCRHFQVYVASLPLYALELGVLKLGTVSNVL